MEGQYPKIVDGDSKMGKGAADEIARLIAGPHPVLFLEDAAEWVAAKVAADLGILPIKHAHSMLRWMSELESTDTAFSQTARALLAEMFAESDPLLCSPRARDYICGQVFSELGIPAAKSRIPGLEEDSIVSYEAEQQLKEQELSAVQEASWERAKDAYPDLNVPGSSLFRRYQEEMERFKATDPLLMQSRTFPETIAGYVAAQEGVLPVFR